MRRRSDYWGKEQLIQFVQEEFIQRKIVLEIE